MAPILHLLLAIAAPVAPLPVGRPVEVALPDYLAEVRSFEVSPPSWNETIVNAGWGGGRGGPERRDGWLRDHWLLLDYVDRSADYTTHDWLANRGIFYEVYGSNEYQETIHFHESGALPLFADNGIARDLENKLVMSQHYNLSVASWAKTQDFNAYIVDNNAPRWSAVIDYDWLTSPLLGDAISQDNIGGPTTRIGTGSRGRYCDFDNRKFLHHLRTSGRLPDYAAADQNIRDYARANVMDLFEQLPPYAKWPGSREAALTICDDPVMAEYQRFQHLSHLHNFLRYYRDAKTVAARAGRQYDVHGNMGGGFIGLTPYQVLLAEFVDTIWFESSGQSEYDLLMHGWSNAWGAFRFEMIEAMARHRQPLMAMSQYRKPSPDICALEWAEACAGGGVLFVIQDRLAKQPELQELLTEYWRFRDEHRALYERPQQHRYCQVGLLYSLPTFLHSQYLTTFDCPATNDLAGAARALEEGHIPYDVVILEHPDFAPQGPDLEQLRGYKLLIAPSVECLSDAHADLLRRYLEGGGTLAVLGKLGVKDEYNRAREPAVRGRLEDAGNVIDLLDGESFGPSRVVESDNTKARTQRVIEALDPVLGEDRIVAGDLPRMLWVKTWRHPDNMVSAHFVNYQIDHESGQATPTEPTDIRLRLPADVPAEEAAWLVPGEKPRELAVERIGDGVRVELPAVRVYGVLLVGPRGLDTVPSLIRRGNRYALRARYASTGRHDRLADPRPSVEPNLEAAKAYCEEQRARLEQVAAEREAAYLERARAAVDATAAVTAFDFGGEGQEPLWKPVQPETVYEKGRGYGWLTSADETAPTPEERDYGGAHKYGGDANEITAGGLLFWPYREAPPRPIRRHLYSGRGERFRIDLPDGRYRVRVVNTMPSWIRRNFLVSGMTWDADRPVLFDAVMDKGDQVARSFAVDVQGGFLELTFGGPTGWGISALIVDRADEKQADPLVEGGLRSWRISPRYPNTDWYPIEQVNAAPEEQLADPPLDAWTAIPAAAEGLPLVDLGTVADAAIGDVVYAATVIEQESAGPARLSLGSSSSAVAWVNGRRVAYLPNVKGVQRDEAVVEVPLRQGRNVLVLKLQRFWERRWLFYAAVSG